MTTQSYHDSSPSDDFDDYVEDLYERTLAALATGAVIPHDAGQVMVAAATRELEATEGERAEYDQRQDEVLW